MVDAEDLLRLGLAVLAAAILGGCESAKPVSADDPRYVELRDRFATQFSQGNLDAALTEARQALELAPSLEEPYIWVSKIYSDLGRDEEGLAFFDNLSETQPEVAHPMLCKARHEYQLRRFDDAVVSFTRCTEIDPEHARCHHWRGVVLEIRGEYPAALTAFDRAYTLEPTSVATATALVSSLRVAGEYERAQQTALEALAREPDSADLLAAVGQLRLRARDYPAAEPRLRSAIRLDPMHREAHEDLARLLHRTGRDEEARREERTATRLQDYEQGKRNMSGHLENARDPAVPLLLGEIELTERQYRAAAQWFTRCQQLGGVGTRGLAGLAETFYRGGDVERGDAVLAQADEAEDARLDLARAARRLATGDPNGAVAILDRAVERGPQEREFLRRAADLYADAGRAAVSDSLLDSAAGAPRASTAPE